MVTLTLAASTICVLAMNYLAGNLASQAATRVLGMLAGQILMVFGISWAVAGLVLLCTWGRVSRDGLVIIAILTSSLIAFLSYRGATI